jgi:TRAP-type C4-dicarboxylate transport system permease small subunit
VADRLKRLVATIDLILYGSKVWAFVCSLFFVCLVLLQVFFRYALNDSLVWAEEAIRFLLYLTVMGSLGLVAAADADIRLGGLGSVLPAGLQQPLVMLCDVIVLIFCAVFIWASLELVELSWGQTSPVMEISMGWVYVAGISGFALAILGTLRKQLVGPTVAQSDLESGLSPRA